MGLAKLHSGTIEISQEHDLAMADAVVLIITGSESKSIRGLILFILFILFLNF